MTRQRISHFILVSCALVAGCSAGPEGSVHQQSLEADDAGIACGDLICEAHETYECPKDCGYTGEDAGIPSCGDMVCEADEMSTCPSDCSDSGQLEYCGDAITQPSMGEACDDGNMSDDDGCSSMCRTEQCGDGMVQSSSGETCDDGNTSTGDGCSDTCRLEDCGNAITQPSMGEACDDGNMSDDDGCSSMCQTERCGDGVVQYSSEMCDDGNTSTGDGCSDTCQLEYCGDAITQLLMGEACDDGNISDDDGCSSMCQTERCGDGMVQYSSETCDDGNTSSDDGCSSTCQVDDCGNLACDEGETADTCASDCGNEKESECTIDPGPDSSDLPTLAWDDQSSLSADSGTEFTSTSAGSTTSPLDPSDLYVRNATPQAIGDVDGDWRRDQGTAILAGGVIRQICPRLPIGGNLVAWNDRPVGDPPNPNPMDSSTQRCVKMNGADYVESCSCTHRLGTITYTGTYTAARTVDGSRDESTETSIRYRNCANNMYQSLGSTVAYKTRYTEGGERIRRARSQAVHGLYGPINIESRVRRYSSGELIFEDWDYRDGLWDTGVYRHVIHTTRSTPAHDWAQRATVAQPGRGVLSPYVAYHGPGFPTTAWRARTYERNSPAPLTRGGTRQPTTYALTVSDGMRARMTADSELTTLTIADFEGREPSPPHLQRFSGDADLELGYWLAWNFEMSRRSTDTALEVCNREQPDSVECRLLWNQRNALSAAANRWFTLVRFLEDSVPTGGDSAVDSMPWRIQEMLPFLGKF